MVTADLANGRFLVIRVAGNVETYEERPRFDRLYALLGCDSVDTVLLTKDPSTGMADLVMLVDDVGKTEGKPVNPVATNLAKAAWGRRYAGGIYPHTIHGDVAIVKDSDFGDPY